MGNKSSYQINEDSKTSPRGSPRAPALDESYGTAAHIYRQTSVTSFVLEDQRKGKETHLSENSNVTVMSAYFVYYFC